MGRENGIRKDGKTAVIFDRTGQWRLEGRWWVRISDGFRLPAIAGGGPAFTVQNDKYAFGTDNGTESGHSLDTENTPRSAQVAGVTFMFRVQIEETAGGTESTGYTLYAGKNGGAKAQVPYSATNNGLRLANDVSSRADDENTTERLSYGGTSSFQTGKYDDGTSAVGTGSFSLDQDNTGYTDLEFALQIDSANASNGDYWDLEVRFTGGGALDGYPGTLPRVTASIVATRTINESDGATIGESVSVTPLALGNVSKTDGLTVADTLVDIAVEGGTPAELDITGVTDDVAIGEAITAQMADMTIDVSDGLTVGESTSVDPLVMGNVSVSDNVTVGEDVTMAFELEAFAVNLGIDNLSAWKQGVVVYG